MTVDDARKRVFVRAVLGLQGVGGAPVIRPGRGQCRGGDSSPSQWVRGHLQGMGGQETGQGSVSVDRLGVMCM